MTIRNPFRIPMMRDTFDAVLKSYKDRHKDIWRPPGQPRPGNAWAGNFWRGYDGVSAKFAPGKGGRNTLAYACFRAGQLVRKEETK